MKFESTFGVCLLRQLVNDFHCKPEVPVVHLMPIFKTLIYDISLPLRCVSEAVFDLIRVYFMLSCLLCKRLWTELYEEFVLYSFQFHVFILLYHPAALPEWLWPQEDEEAVQEAERLIEETHNTLRRMEAGIKDQRISGYVVYSLRH